MKKVKSLMALLLSISFCLSIVACGRNEGALPPTQTDGSESSSSDILEGDEGTFEDSASELPPATTPDSTPESPSEPSTPPEVTPPAVTPTPPTVTPEKPTVPETPTVNKKAQYIRLTGDRVNLRSGAGTGYKVLNTAKEGTMYALIESKSGWYKTYYRGQTAYVSTSYAAVLSLEKSDTDKVEKVITEGYKLLGTPYVYGAVRLHDGKGNLLSNFSVHKFDCSSLIQYIFYKGAGKVLDVNTRTQVKQGQYVKKSELQRGDCIFFTNEERQYNKGIERVGHVALYLGDNYILHTASDYACIEKISAKRWSFYIEARRFL